MGWPARLLDRALIVYGRGLPYHPKKLWVVAALDRIARHSWKGPRTGIFHGVRFEFDPQSWVARSIYYLGEWEHWDTLRLIQTIEPGWAVVDVGANLGYYTLLAALLTGPEGRVYAFEPAPSTFKTLLRNIELNAAPNVEVYEAALSDTHGVVSLIEGAQDDFNRIGPAGEGARREAPCWTLDQFVEANRIQRVDLVKVDIEGAEHKFLLGARKTIQRFRPIIVIELNPATLSLYGSTVQDVVRELEGYKLYRASWRGFGPLKALPKQGQSFNAVALPRRP